jgi:hypothetical protein
MIGYFGECVMGGNPSDPAIKPSSGEVVTSARDYSLNPYPEGYEVSLNREFSVEKT